MQEVHHSWHETEVDSTVVVGLPAAADINFVIIMEEMGYAARLSIEATNRKGFFALVVAAIKMKVANL